VIAMSEQSSGTEKITAIVAEFHGDDRQKMLRVLKWIGDNIAYTPHVDPSWVFRKRADEIIDAGLSYDPSDNALVFCALANAAGVQSRMVVWVVRDLVRGLKWQATAESLIGSEWVAIDANPPSPRTIAAAGLKELEREYCVLGTGNDPWDMKITCLYDLKTADLAFRRREKLY
jgi:hypothetical protein